MRLSSLVLCLGLVGCGGSKTKPAPVTPTTADGGGGGTVATPSDAELAQIYEGTLAFFESLAGAFADNQDDCKGMALALDQVFDDNQQLLVTGASLKGNVEFQNKGKAFMEGHKDRLDAATARMAPGLKACAEDPDVAERMKRFDDL